ncbi:hypothetical protein K1T71_000803 [Dendrolimus kikuchii]|uniref:Uncharacterized protein n=1 Tax=Dendrolimus kikuchii TaxID=765133 RepID=A0ACC1DKE7_9NEOP|nr:hypothetical protein K1T71_000803 [Dendrolimus kikuchii]
MAFSLRKMLSNISYFTKPEDAPNENRDENFERNYFPRDLANFERIEADSTSKCESLNLPESIKQYALKKGSLSDTDILNITPKEKRKFKKLKLDIHKASQSLSDKFIHSEDSSNDTENTPKHVLLECKRSELFSEKLKKFNFDLSFDISDSTSNDSLSDDENLDIESLTDHTESELTEVSSDEVKVVKMCRKVAENVQSMSPESFAEVDIDRNNGNIMFMYQSKFERIENILKNLLKEFQFQIEVPKVLNLQSNAVKADEKTDNPERMYLEDIKSAAESPSWDMLSDNNVIASKVKIQNHLQSINKITNAFLNTYFQHSKLNNGLTFDIHKGKKLHRQARISEKKRIRHFDFPDLRDSMLNLFNMENEDIECSANNIDSPKCCCKCQCQDSVILKTETDTSITSSIGNFTLDSTTISAYSESLDVISYNSFDDSNLYTTFLQKASMERIIFYIQAHSIQIHCVPSNDYESKNIITFNCPSCNITENEENGLLKHILSQKHCEKLHFIYKTAYIKKCVAEGKEIMPSTVLNPMKFYRDDNKIVCFGDAVYACTLCFENSIVGESVLMAHVSESEHLSRRDMLYDIIG